MIKTLKILSLITIIFTATQVCKAQDTLTIKKVLGSCTIYSSDGDKISISNAIAWSDDNAEALAAFKKAKNNAAFSTILGGVGGFMLGFQLGGAIVSGTIKSPPLLLVGIGLIGLSIPFEIKKNRNIIKAVDLYNKPHRK